MKETKTPAPEKAATAATDDLSAEIIKTIERDPGDQVTCRRITGDRYRCNWWQQQNTSTYDNPCMGGLLVTTARIRKSRFLRVTKTPEGLKFDQSGHREQ